MLEKIQNILFPLEGKNFKRHAVDQMPQTSNENMQQASEPVCPNQSSFIHMCCCLKSIHEPDLEQS